MGLPPTSPRFKFVYTNPGGSPVPRRPPRHPSSPSNRSRSLELLDQDEKKTTAPVAVPEPQPRPRSRSLDGLLDEDGVVPTTKTDEEESSSNTVDDKIELEKSLIGGTIVTDSDEASGIRIVIDKCPDDEDNDSERKTAVSRSPIPVPRAKTKGSTTPENQVQIKSKQEAKENEENSMTRSSKINNNDSTDEEASRRSSMKEDVESEVRKDSVKARLSQTENEKSTLLKAKSCGAGLDSDGSTSSNEYKPKTKGQGSLLSLPTGAEPKRKKNFMDKCVNKVRSFIRK